MAKRLKPGEELQLIGLVLVLVLICVAGATVIDSFGIVVPVVAGVGLVIAIAAYLIYKNKKRLAYLRQKYSDESIVQRILQRGFWEGQTSEQLLDSLGSPSSVDRKNLKTISREIWKYQQHGKNRYGLRITLDSGVVVGWDQKSP